MRYAERLFPLLFVILLICASCNNELNRKVDSTSIKSQETTNSNIALPAYSIIQIDENTKVKCVIIVRIQNKLNNMKIEALAWDVKKRVNPVSEHVYVFLLLPAMIPGNGAWARAEFNPELSIEIIGQTINADEHISNYLKSNQEHFIGQWVNNFFSADLIYRMKLVENKIILEVFSPSENNVAPLSELRKVKKGSQVRFVTDDEYGQYYIIEENGNLSSYDNDGLITTYTKIK